MKNQKKPKDICVIQWNWNKSMSISDLNKCTQAGFIFFQEVYTYGDYYGIVGTKEEISQEVAQWAYNAWHSESEDYNSESGYSLQLIMFLDTDNEFIPDNED